MSEIPGITPPPVTPPPPGDDDRDISDRTKQVRDEIMTDMNLKIAIGGFILMFVGLLLPWVSVTAGPFEATSSGFSTGDGKLVLLLTVAGLIVLYLRKSVIAIVLTVIAAAITLWDIIDIASVSTDVPEGAGITVSAGTGFGIWLTIIGLAAMVVASVLQQRSA